MNENRQERIFFIGGKNRGYSFIKYMIKKNENFIGALVMEEDKHEIEKYSGQISKLLTINAIPFKLGKNAKGKECYEFIHSLKPSLIVVMGWRSIIQDRIIKIPKRGTVAVHESLLPKYRGFAPVNWVLINGETRTGVTLFFLDNGMDSGNIIVQKKVKISSDDNAQTLYQKTSAVSLELLKKYLPMLKKGTAPTRKQVNKLASYACARTPDDGLINWNDTTKNILNLIRGLSYPYPGAFTYFKGEKIIISRASMPEQRKFIGRIPGRVVSSIKGKGVEVLTRDGVILIEEVFKNSNYKKDPSEIINSVKVALGQ